MIEPWHTLSVDAATQRLKSDAADGLGREEAERRLARCGPNEIVEAKRRSVVVMFLVQFRDFPILVLISVALLSGVLGDLVCRSVVQGIVLTAAAQGALAGVGYLAAGVGAPLLIAMLTALAALPRVAVDDQRDAGGTHTSGVPNGRPASRFLTDNLIRPLVISSTGHVPFLRFGGARGELDRLVSLNSAVVRARFRIDLDKTHTIALGIAVHLMPVDIDLRSAGFLRFAPPFPADRNGHVAADDDRQHHRAEVFLVSALQEDDATRKHKRPSSAAPQLLPALRH